MARIGCSGFGEYLDKIGDKNKTACLATATTDFLPLDKDAPHFRSRVKRPKAFAWQTHAARSARCEVHDCFSITEIVARNPRLADPGKGVELVKSGATTLPQVRPEKSKRHSKFRSTPAAA
jgi:hypothetical protein